MCLGHLPAVDSAAQVMAGPCYLATPEVNLYCDHGYIELAEFEFASVVGLGCSLRCALDEEWHPSVGTQQRPLMPSDPGRGSLRLLLHGPDVSTLKSSCAVASEQISLAFVPMLVTTLVLQHFQGRQPKNRPNYSELFHVSA